MRVLSAALAVWLVQGVVATPGGAARPSQAWCVAADVSGSMLGRELEILAAGLQSFTAELPRGAELGVVAFASEARVVLPLGRARDAHLLGALQEAARSVRNGTRVRLALATCEAMLTPSQAAERHVIVASDGVTPYALVDSEWVPPAVTVHAVAIGASADPAFLRQLSDVGGGRFAVASELADAPEAFRWLHGPRIGCVAIDDASLTRSQRAATRKIISAWRKQLGRVTVYLISKGAPAAGLRDCAASIRRRGVGGAVLMITAGGGWLDGAGVAEAWPDYVTLSAAALGKRPRVDLLIPLTERLGGVTYPFLWPDDLDETLPVPAR